MMGNGYLDLGPEFKYCDFINDDPNPREVSPFVK